MLEPRYGLFLATGEEEDFLETMSNQGTSKEDDVPMPGFRFHPTDEELVAFYLRRKVEKKPISIELIKQIDIYKYDPWDLPKASCSTGQDLEWYFFCKRGRKYRNSIRPNRVTGSGFWKATGIDKPVYSGRGERGHERIGLKKTLVYYSGSAGKGTKTDWMMHEFRLPANEPDTDSDLANAKSTAPEAEIWTLCRIFKRNVSHRKYTPDWRELSAKKHPTSSSSQVLSMDCDNREDYISFDTPFLYRNEKPEEIKPVVNLIDERNQLHAGQSSSMASLPLSSSLTISPVPDANELFAYENWDDELRSFVEFALDPSRM